MIPNFLINYNPNLEVINCINTTNAKYELYFFESTLLYKFFTNTPNIQNIFELTKISDNLYQKYIKEYLYYYIAAFNLIMSLPFVFNNTVSTQTYFFGLLNSIFKYQIIK